MFLTSPSCTGSLGGKGLIHWGPNPSNGKFRNNPITVSSLSPDPSLGLAPGCRSNLKYDLISNVEYTGKQNFNCLDQVLYGKSFKVKNQENSNKKPLRCKGSYSSEFASQPFGTSGSGTTLFTEPSLNKQLYGSGWILSQYCCCNCSHCGKDWQ